ncbi:Uncharacterised protein [Vibrio cholerae]|nr:Uncharacterised protein [Vibrio cholerae]
MIRLKVRQYDGLDLRVLVDNNARYLTWIHPF